MRFVSVCEGDNNAKKVRLSIKREKRNLGAG
jgi:hypothetical protein